MRCSTKHRRIQVLFLCFMVFSAYYLTIMSPHEMSKRYIDKCEHTVLGPKLNNITFLKEVRKRFQKALLMDPNTTRKDFHAIFNNVKTELRLKNIVDASQDNKPKAFVYLMVRTSWKRYRHTFRILADICLNFLSKYDYPLVLFHDKTFPKWFWKSYVEFYTQYTGIKPVNLLFYQIDIDRPALPNIPMADRLPTGCPGTIDYRDMCHFQSKTIHEIPLFQHVEYTWRLDDDSRILEPIKIDVFQYMKDKKLTYGYVATQGENIECAICFQTLVSKYLAVYNKPTKLYQQRQNQIKGNLMFYNNFEISKVEFWFSENYQSFLDFIISTGGIYYLRWGDAMVHSFAVWLFLEENQIHEFTEIAYEHQQYRTKGIK